LTGDLQAHLCAQGLRHPDLQRPQVAAGLFLEGGTEGFGREPSIDFAYSNGPGRTVLLGQCHKSGTTQPLGDVSMGFPTAQQIYKAKEMFNDLVRVCWCQGLFQVVGAQAGRAGTGVLVEGFEGGGNVIGLDCRHKPVVGHGFGRFLAESWSGHILEPSRSKEQKIKCAQA